MLAARGVALLRRCWSRIDLRFPGPVEALYKKDVEARLVLYIAVAGTLLGIYTTIVVFKETIIQTSREDDPMQWSALEARTVRLGGAAVNASLFAVAALLASLYIFCGCFRSVDWEAWIVVFILVQLQQVMLCRPSFYNAVCRSLETDCVLADLKESFHLGHEILALLFLDLSLTAIHLYMPIRSCRVLLVDIVAYGEYSAITLYLARNGHFILNFSDTLNVLLAFLILVILAFEGGRANEKHARSNWNAQGRLVEQQGQLDQQEKAMARILSRLCDGLVRLGSDLKILEHSPSLGALLFRTETMGSNFGDFMKEEEERAALGDALLGKVSDGVAHLTEGEGGMMHISLLDTYRHTVRVQAHYAHFRAESGESQLLLGLVETGERQLPESKSQLTAKPMPLPELPGRQEVSLKQASDGRFVVEWASPELSLLLGGPREGEPARVLCVGSDRAGFESWLQDGIESAVLSGTADASYGRLVIPARSEQGNTIQYKAAVSGTFTQQTGKVVLHLQPPKSIKVKKDLPGRGTPAYQQHEDLSDGESSRSSASGGPPVLASAQHPLETNKHARKISALSLLSTWNVRVRKSTCCGYHACVGEAMAVFTELRKCNCERMKDIVGSHDWQCPCCGIIPQDHDEEGNLCDNCAAQRGAKATRR